MTEAKRSYLVCATPRSGSTLVCKTLRETGVAGRPEEYFEALRSTGRPRRPQEYFEGVDDRSIFDEGHRSTLHYAVIKDRAGRHKMMTVRWGEM